ncbi:hypothetical protein NKDENANG_02534 [Candidatus Entotheonellaceae bacterium PAL068K]
MEREELRKLVAEIQTRRMEPDSVEVKSANQGTPKLYDSLSSFANRFGGGVILLGLDENQAFKIVGVGNPQRVQEEVSSWARSEMEPPVTVEFTVDEIDDEVVMAIDIQEVPNEQKPCYYKPQGLRGNGGAYLRSGGTDRSMTDYEIFGYVSSRGQPKHDEDVITDATLDDLDRALVDDYLNRLRTVRPRAGYLDGPRDEVLSRLHVCSRDGEVVKPTLAGLLMFGKFPQEFLPQLMITFVQYYGATEEERTPRGERFMDNQRFEGAMPEMLDRTGTYILGAMRKSSLIEGIFRRDVPEYPQEALHEAVANAVAHRDYSPSVRGSYIQIRMFADRLEIQSPGGLFGNVTVDNIAEEHSTRNARLMRMMEDAHLIENRGSGIKAMLHALRAANLEPPAFDDRRSSFKVTFRNHTLMNPDAVAWLNQFAGTPLNDRQRQALVYLRQHQHLNNSDYRWLNHVDPMLASQELRGLVDTDLVDQEGIGRWTRYRLKVSPELAEQRPPQTDED